MVKAQAERSASTKTCGSRNLVCLGNSKENKGRGGGKSGKEEVKAERTREGKAGRGRKT